MAKGKGQPGVQNRHIYTRASYLYQAAAYLATTAASLPQLPPPSNTNSNTNNGQSKYNKKEEPNNPLQEPTTKAEKPSLSSPEDQHKALKTLSSPEDQRKALQNTSRLLLADMRAVSLKVMIRQRPELKRTICRYCDSLLIEGSSCDAVVENASKGGRKPWADVLVLRCRACGGAKRFPVEAPAKKQMRRSLRASVVKASSETDQGDGSKVEES